VAKIVAQVQNSDLSFFFTAVFAVNVTVLIQSMRGYMLLEKDISKISFIAYSKSYFISMAASATLLGRIGAISQVPLLHKHGITTGVGVVNVLYDKLCDLSGFLIMGAFFATLQVNKDFYAQSWALLILATLVLTVTWYIDLIFYTVYNYVAVKASCNWLPPMILSRLSNKVKLRAIFLTFIRLFGSVIVHFFCARAVGLHVPIDLIAAAAAFGAIATLLPITVMGVGVRESSFLIVFSGQHYPNEQVLAFAFLLLLCYLSTVVIGVFIALSGRSWSRA
jgi:uncharacterized membrane protein YbhN (UPF0104 family)